MDNIIENNRLIAEFMGADIEIWEANQRLGEDIYTDAVYIYFNGEALCDEELHYHTDWNWLMEVVEKIESVKSYDRDVFGTEVKIYKDKCTIKSGHYNTKGVVYSKEQYFDGIRQEKSKIESTYTLCVDFIKWYNKQK